MALSYMPRLIRLLIARQTLCGDDKKKLNFWTFRLGVTLQDMAELKLHIGIHQDAVLHL